jgi:hypothetical protein
LKKGGTSGRSIESQIEVMQSCILDVIFDRLVYAAGDALQSGRINSWADGMCLIEGRFAVGSKSRERHEVYSENEVRGEVSGPIRQ